MSIRGIRGAVRAKANTRKSILAAARKLMRAVVRTNRIHPENVASCFFTMTPDLNADFPAYAAREMKSWKHVPLLGATEVAVPGAMDRIIRVLILVDTEIALEKIQHQYLGETKCLRPDLVRSTRKKRRRK